MIEKYQQMFGILLQQIEALKNAAIPVLSQQDKTGVLRPSYFALAEAVEKVIKAQMVIEGNDQPNTLYEMLKNIRKLAEKLESIAQADTAEATLVKDAMAEKQDATIH